MQRSHAGRVLCRVKTVSGSGWRKWPDRKLCERDRNTAELGERSAETASISGKQRGGRLRRGGEGTCLIVALSVCLDAIGRSTSRHRAAVDVLTRWLHAAPAPAPTSTVVADWNILKQNLANDRPPALVRPSARRREPRSSRAAGPRS